MKSVPVSHASYQASVIHCLRFLYSNTRDNMLKLFGNDFERIHRLFLTDLSALNTMLLPTYSSQGPASRKTATIMRSYFLYLSVAPEKDIIQWVDMLRRIPLYAIISGFSQNDTPGVSTFYDFFSRIWGNYPSNIKPSKQSHVKKKPKKPKKKGGEGSS